LRREFAATICKRSGSVLLILSKQSCLVPLRPVSVPSNPPTMTCRVPPPSRLRPGASRRRPLRVPLSPAQSCLGPAPVPLRPAGRRPAGRRRSARPPGVLRASRPRPGGVPQVAAGRRSQKPRVPPGRAGSRRSQGVRGAPYGAAFICSSSSWPASEGAVPALAGGRRPRGDPTRTFRSREAPHARLEHLRGDVQAVVQHASCSAR